MAKTVVRPQRRPACRSIPRRAATSTSARLAAVSDDSSSSTGGGAGGRRRRSSRCARQGLGTRSGGRKAGPEPRTMSSGFQAHLDIVVGRLFIQAADDLVGDVRTLIGVELRRGLGNLLAGHGLSVPPSAARARVPVISPRVHCRTRRRGNFPLPQFQANGVLPRPTAYSGLTRASIPARPGRRFRNEAHAKSGRDSGTASGVTPGAKARRSGRRRGRRMRALQRDGRRTGHGARSDPGK
jgi:hypothetical protein